MNHAIKGADLTRVRTKHARSVTSSRCQVRSAPDLCCVDMPSKMELACVVGVCDCNAPTSRVVPLPDVHEPQRAAASAPQAALLTQGREREKT